jgi:hypothetical protein
VYQREVSPCTYPALHSIPPLNVPRSSIFWKTSGYCWSTSKYRNLCVQHAFFEGKKAQETFPRKSTSRTLRQVDQQYPSVCWTPFTLPYISARSCPETRYSNQRRVDPAYRNFFDTPRATGLHEAYHAVCDRPPHRHALSLCWRPAGVLALISMGSCPCKHDIYRDGTRGSLGSGAVRGWRWTRRTRLQGPAPRLMM